MNIKKLTIAILATSVTSFAFANNSLINAIPGVADYKQINHPVSLQDYQQVESTTDIASITGNFNANNNANTDLESSYDLELIADTSKNISSASSTTEFNADANISLADKGDSNLQENWNFGVGAAYNQYFTSGSNGAYWFGAGDVDFKQEVADTAGLEKPKAAISGGLGYGRVINATPMAQAMKVVQSLVESGVLKAVPAKASYAKVAAIIDKEAEYKTKARGNKNENAYTQAMATDIANVFGNVGAIGALKIYEVLDKGVSARQYGWKAQAGTGVTLSTFESGFGVDVSPNVNAKAEYHKPIGLQAQFSNTAESVLNINKPESFNLDNTMTLDYDLSNDGTWKNKWMLSYDNASEALSNNLSTGYSHKLTSDLSLSTTVTLSNNMIDGYYDDISAKLNSGIVYTLK